MDDGSPSRTALKVAALRALHQTIDVPPVFIDPLAEKILGARRSELLDAYRATADETLRLRGTLAARTVIAEEAIVDAVEHGVRQVVVLGAGLDTFAYRHSHPELVVYEADHPMTQAWKHGLLREGGIETTAHVRYAPLDFERDHLFAGLALAGFDAAKPAIFAMLGVSFYLAWTTILNLLQAIAETCAKGSEIVFDYTEPYEDAPEPVRAAYAAVAARAAAGGEPWLSLFRPAAIHDALRERGFSVVADFDAAHLHQRFFDGRTDGLTIAALMHMLRARA